MPTQPEGTLFWRRYPTSASFAITIIILVLGFSLYSYVQSVKIEDLRHDLAEMRSEVKNQQGLERERNEEAIRRSASIANKLDKNADVTSKCYEKLDTILKGMMEVGR